MKTLLMITGITIALAAIGVAVRAKESKKPENQYRFFVYELENYTMQEKLEYMISFLDFHDAEYVNHEINEDQLTIICKFPSFDEMV